MTLTIGSKKYAINAYKAAIFIAAMFGILIMTPFLLKYLILNGLLSKYAIDFFWLPFSIISSIVSGNGYTGKWLDFIKALKQNFSSPRAVCSAENIGLTLGLLAGITVTVILITLHLTLPFSEAFTQIGAMFFSSIGYLSIFGGLGNRSGRLVNFIYSNSSDLKKTTSANYALSIGAGIVIGLILTTTVLLTISTGAGGLSVFLLTVGTISAISSCASSCGYIGRVFDFILGSQSTLFNKNPFEFSTFKQRCSRENIGTTIGVITGIIIASIIIGLGIVTLPFFGIGISKIIAGIFMISLCISSAGGLGNRLGHLFEPENAAVEITENKKFSSSYTKVTNTSRSEPELLPGDKSAHKICTEQPSVKEKKVKTDFLTGIKQYFNLLLLCRPAKNSSVDQISPEILPDQNTYLTAVPTPTV